jgi:hypothetical protein
LGVIYPNSGPVIVEFANFIVAQDSRTLSVGTADSGSGWCSNFVVAFGGKGVRMSVERYADGESEGSVRSTRSKNVSLRGTSVCHSTCTFPKFPFE